MRITPMVRAQLVIFAVVTVLSLVVVGVYYIRIPSMLGVGHTRLQVEFPTTGGLYESANVTFSGVVVGKVDSVKLTPTGVVASLSVDSAAEIPADSQASVHSVSAVGEQYVEFTPAPDHGAGTLEDGAVITNGTVPVDVGTLLDQVDALLAKIQDTKLRRVLDEAFDAFNGTGEDLQRLLDSTALLAGDANENSDVIVELIEHAAPLLESQSATTEEIRAWTANLATTTDRLRANDPQLRDILQKAPGVAHQAQDLFASMNQSLPLLFSNLDTTARTLAIYHPNLRQTLVLYPRVLATLYTSLNSEDPRNGANVDFALGFEDPGTCTVGFLPMTPDRNGGDQTSRDLPPGMLCRVPQDSNLAVRGTRNFPCVEFPGRRASTPAECATGYEPLGENVPLPEGIPGLIPPPPAQDSQESVPQGTVVPASAHTENDGPAVYATTYDPISGDYFGPDGNMYNAGTGVTGDGTSASSGKGDGPTWESLIEGTVA